MLRNRATRFGRQAVLSTRMAAFFAVGGGVIADAAPIYLGRTMSEGMVRTDQLSYDVSAGPTRILTISFIVTNTSRQIVYLPPDGRGLLELEQEMGRAWHVVARPISTLELQPPITILPGASVRDIARLDLSGGISPARALDQIPGRYRVVYAIFLAWNPRGVGGPPGKLLRKAQRTSNVFTLRIADGPQR